MVSIYASLSEVSLEMRPPREFSLGFGTIEASFWRCSDLLPEVSTVFDRTEATLGEVFPLTPASQRSLWKCVPPVSSLSGSVPPRHLFGAVAIYYRRSLQYSIVEKLLLGKYFPRTPAFHRSLWKCTPPPREFSLGFGTIKAYFWRCSNLLPEVSPVFDRTEAVLGDMFPTYASLPEVSLEMRPPREFSLGFGTIKAYIFFLALYRSTTGGLSSIRSYRCYSWGSISRIRQPSRGLSGNASPPVSSLSGLVPSRIFLALHQATTGGLGKSDCI